MRAREAVGALVTRAVRDGATLRLATARPTATGAAEVDGAVLGADHTVWACGPWLGRLFPEHARVGRRDRISSTGASRPPGGRIAPRRGSTSRPAATASGTSTAPG